MKLLLLIPALLWLAACSHSHDDTASHDAEVAPLVYTLFNKETELFVEFDPLVVGESSTFITHLTFVDSFRPVASGQATVILSGGGQPEERFIGDASSTAGIFRPLAEPRHAGERQLTLLWQDGERLSRHELGTVTVHPAGTTLPAANAEEDNAISFLKETQWKIDFATAEVGQRDLQQSLSVPATISARNEDEAWVNAPADGILQARGRFPKVGDKVTQGDVLASVNGRPIRASISGTLSQIRSNQGDRVIAGFPLFHIATLSRLWLEVKVPEADIIRLPQHPSDVWFTVSGNPQVYRARTGEQARLISQSPVVDKTSRSLSLVFELPNPEPGLHIGQFAQAHLVTAERRNTLAIPASAIVRSSGQAWVFVMQGGESFEQRAVHTGLRDGEWVEVVDGLKAGERIVTRGAYRVYMASVAPADTSHSHDH